MESESILQGKTKQACNGVERRIEFWNNLRLWYVYIGFR